MGKSNRVINSEVGAATRLFDGIRIVNSIIGEKCTIGDDCDIVNLWMEDKTELGRRNIIRDSKLGRASYTGTNTVIKNAEIGRFCCISWNVSIGGGNHDTRHTSMYTSYWFHRNFGISVPEVEGDVIKTTIGNDVWIAAGVIINNGVTVGDGCAIGAGAVIVEDVPPWSVVVGVPGKVIKRRFDEKISKALEMLKWWEWTDGQITKYYDVLCNTPNVDEIHKIMEEIDAQNSDK